jgi:hypothetical protein
LTLWYAAVLALVLAAYAGGVLAVLRQSLLRDLDRALHDDRETAEQMLERHPDGSIGWRAEPGDHDHDEDEEVGGRWLEVRGDTGHLLFARPGKIPRETSVRRASAPYTVDGQSVTLIAARSEEPLRRELRRLLLVMGLGLPLALVLASVGGYALALEPLSADLEPMLVLQGAGGIGAAHRILLHGWAVAPWNRGSATVEG